MFKQKVQFPDFIEPIDGNERTSWGDLDPATKKIKGDYGLKYKGSIKPEETMITEENGFKNIVTLEAGQSPMDYIEKIDKENECSVKNS